MRRGKYNILLLLLLLVYGGVPAQEFTYQVYTAANGLPTSEIISLGKDSRGFLWVGSMLGISRFDGYSFENFQYSADNYFLGQVNCIKEDYRKKLWIGTNAGLYYFENNAFYKFSIDHDFIPQGINDILPEENGGLWLATEAGPAYITAKELSAANEKIDLPQKILPQWATRAKGETKDRKRATIIRKAPDGTVFIAGFTAIYRYNNDSLTCLLSNYDFKTNFQIHSIFPVSKDKVYFDEAKLQLHKIENGKTMRLGLDPLYKPTAIGEGLPAIYLCTSGILRFYPQNELVNFQFNTFDIGVVWPSAILYDSLGLYWLATHDGLYKIKPSVFKPYNVKTFNNRAEAYSFIENSTGELLMGANRGKLYIKTKDSFNFYLPKTPKIFPLAEIFGMYEDKRKWIWLGSGYQGMAVYKNGEIKNYTEEDGIHDNSIRNFLETGKNRLFAIGDMGLTEVLIDDKEKISFKKFYAQKRISQYATFYSAIEGPDGKIWLGGEEGIFYLQKDSVYRFNLTNRDLYVYDIKKDIWGNVWVATSGEGILQCTFDKEGKLVIVQKFTERQGLNTAVFMHVLPDKEGNLWAASPKGLSYIGMHGKYKGSILNFDENDGFVKSGYINPVLYQDAKGIIWFGSSNGLVSFNPVDITVSTIKPKVHIMGFGVQGIKAKMDNYVRGYRDNLPVDLSLPFNKNSISINYTAIDFNNSEAIRYLYQLEGADTGYVYARNQRIVNYQNLKPGHYRFNVKAINDKFIWSEEVASFTFTITPPFWKTWWFIGTCILMGVYFLYRLYRLLQQKYETQKILNRFITALYGKNTPEEIFRSIAYNCIHQLGFKDCVVYQLDERRKVLMQKAAAGPKSPEGFEIINPIEIPVGKGIVGSVAKTGKSEIIGNTALDSRYIVDDEKRLSEITVSIIIDGEIYGIIDSEHPKKNFYRKYHLQILENIAQICAVRITKYLTEEKLRSQIARDLHDDMGSTLSSINIISKMALQNNATDGMVTEYLSTIKDNSGRMLESMSDIVWAINPTNDTVEKVILRMKEFAAEILEPLNIQYHFREEGSFNIVQLSLNQRKDFYLIFKEAINNAAKYSACSNIEIELVNNGTSLQLSVKDNGKGFEESKKRYGNGLQNMQTRALAMKAELQIAGETGKGVHICLSVPLQHNVVT